MIKNVLFLLVLIQLSAANKVSYEGHRVWSIVATNGEDVKVISSLQSADGLDFWGTKSLTALTTFQVRIPPEKLTQISRVLSSHHIKYEVMIPNLQELINKQTAASSRSNKVLNSITEFDYSVYHNADEIEEWGDVLVSEFSFATKFQVGVSYLGNVLNTIEIRKPSPTGSFKPIVYLDTLIHAREWVTGGATMFVLKEILTNPTYSSLLDEVDFIYVPIVNIDGYRHSWDEDRLWRKTRTSGVANSCTGADPNRNFDSLWSGEGLPQRGASLNPCSNIYCGATPHSENVIRHLTKYITSLKDDIYGLLSVHSWAQMILFPWGWSEEATSDYEMLNNIGKLMSDAIKAVHGKEYTYGQSSTTIYVTTGDTTDWAYEKAGIKASYTYELRDADGTYGFLLPEDQIIPNGEEFLAGVVSFAEYVRDNWQNMK